MAEVIQKLQFKRGTCADLTAILVGAEKLSAGEPAYEVDTGKMKIGNGVDDYASLSYFGGAGEQIIFKSHYEFPNVGEANKLYVATDEHNTYIWENTKYVIISVDQHEIDAGGADAIY